MTECVLHGRREAEAAEALDLGPRSVHEVITRQMVETLRGELHEIKNRLNGLLFAVVGAFAIDVALRLTGS